MPAKTEAIDETWDDSDVGAPREPSSPPEEDEHKRPTAAPAVPPEVLAAAMLHPKPTTRAAWMDDSRFALPTPVAPADVEPPESTSRLAGLNPKRRAKGPIRKSSAPSIEVVGSVDIDLDVIVDPAQAVTTPPPRGPINLDLDEPPKPKNPRPVSAPEGPPRIELDSMRPEPARNPAPVDDLELQIEDALGGSALDLVNDRVAKTEDIPSRPNLSIPEPAPDSASDSDITKELRDRYALGDFTGALVIAESILETDPANEHARRYIQSCREVLTQMYAARLGPLDQLVTVTIPPEQITWLSLDHRAGFLLSLVDGVSSIEEILDISGMTRLEAMRIMYTLVQQNVIALG